MLHIATTSATPRATPTLNWRLLAERGNARTSGRASVLEANGASGRARARISGRRHVRKSRVARRQVKARRTSDVRMYFSRHRHVLHDARPFSEELGLQVPNRQRLRGICARSSLRQLRRRRWRVRPLHVQRPLQGGQWPIRVAGVLLPVTIQSGRTATVPKLVNACESHRIACHFLCARGFPLVGPRCVTRGLRRGAQQVDWI
mmetsp:Transcript_20130/g.55701  ORF Transcript_20130/g.55701 Transcript_20130/m.55701 type:complete len:204 (+) Transcript_20130:301-912(+)